jgi:aminoglycoside/choline kinase family phosphotransferase
MKEEFLRTCGVDFAALVGLAQDASLKTYHRVILKDANHKPLLLLHFPDTLQNFNRFIAAAQMLIEHNLIAPRIFGIDRYNFFILLEDFGDMSVNNYLRTYPEQEDQIYRQIIDSLHQMQKISLPNDDSVIYKHAKFLKELEITTNWYFPYCKINKTESLAEQYQLIWQQILEQLPELSQVFVHKDFHVDNLFITENQIGINSIGIIDFQDYALGSPVYDLVSLLSDARRQVSKQLQDQMLRYYLEISGMEFSSMIKAYHIIGAQNISRILGVFARFAIKGDDRYVKCIPRIKAYLAIHLDSTPELASLKHFMIRHNLL